MDNNIKLDNFDEYVIDYFNKWKKSQYADIGPFELIFKLLHVIIIFYILLGIFSPSKLAFFHIIFLLLLLLSWKIFNGCILTLLFNKTSFVPLSNGKKERIIYILLLISSFNYIFPRYSLFNITHNIMGYLNDNYN